jgi:FixJ family two-component response regulator
MMQSGSTICIVDDDEDVRESIGSFFRSAGVTARSFDRAEALLTSPDFDAMDCLITDLHMPGMSGLDLHREVRNRGRMVPVILMTAFLTDEISEEAKRVGIACFVAKPTDPDWLLDEVQSLLAQDGPDTPSHR